MKARLIAVMVALVALLAAPCAWAGPARLIKAEGKVWVTQPQGKEARAVAGSSLVPGSRIRTGSDGQAELEFKDGSLLRVRPNSSMSLSGNKRPASRKNSVVLFFGRMWSKVTSGEPDHYEVKTANAVCGVRGTEFETAVADDGSVRVRVTGGVVAVTDENSERGVRAGQEVAGDENGVGGAGTASSDPGWESWEAKKKARLAKNGRSIVDTMKGKIMSRKAQLEKLRARQKQIEAQRKDAERRARSGDRGAIEQIRKYNFELSELADKIADIGDEAESQFGMVDHYADLANDPRFKMIDRKYLVAEAASLRRIKAMFDEMIAEGTDISAEAMDDLLKDMSSGTHDSLRDGDTAADDLFGGDDMDMR